MVNREILFRAKHQQSEDINDIIWVYGNLCLDSHRYRISLPAIQTVPNPYETSQSKILYTIHHPETIAQFTGFTDKNGVKIFEGDIVHYQDYVSDVPIIYKTKIVFIRGAFCVRVSETRITPFFNLSNEMLASMEVVGNIHDTSETKDQCNSCEYSHESPISGGHCEGCHQFVNFVRRKGLINDNN